MKFIKLTLLVTVVVLMNSCASGYKEINPQSINYSSRDESNYVKLEYKYNILKNNKYQKKEKKNNLKLVALKITNNSTESVVFGRDVKLTNQNGSELPILQNDVVYKSLKQKPGTYLWYLLLSFFTYQEINNGVVTKTIPVGLVAGAGIAGGNMIVSSSANDRFKTELSAYDLTGKTISPGKSIYGVVGVFTNSYDVIKVKVTKKELQTVEQNVVQKEAKFLEVK